VLWGAAAVVLPWVVRGRSALLDLVAATGWAAALAAGTSARARPLEPHLAHATPRGLTLGALAGAALALTLHAPRGRAAPAPLP
jgi:hypothetical protein